ncbi:MULTISPECIES: chorismate-binding protein [unclassified Actinotalea]|uniref:chorismate-binding protein n=1 Tax=unclassified Actinotalea TaxID=2638618 RepID=UPI002105E1CE|nr:MULTISPECIES: chorismate-binding protein [unclassified Actinotalea]
MPVDPLEVPRLPVEGWARFAGVRARGPVECVDVLRHPERLEHGFWVVVGEFDGPVRAWRFAEVTRDGVSPGGLPWRGPPADAWSSSMSRDAYLAGVAAVRERIRAGDVYQVNLCRVLSAPLPAGSDGAEPSAAALAAALEVGNPAPHAGALHVPAGQGLPPAWVVSASPELFLRVRDGGVGSGPIKGTAATAAGLSGKDRAENVMIADMVRNDLQRVCRPGTVEVTSLLGVEHHPGLVHLVTRVEGRLLPGQGWERLLAATFPPASVSGAPKRAALSVIRELEPGPRGPYCGAFGWVDGDRGEAELAVAIRTFWWTADGRLHFGTGAGLTWGSDAAAEWAETELKAARLVALASATADDGTVPPGADEEDDR